MEKYRRGLRLAACLLALATCAVLLCSCLHPGKADSYTAAMPVIVVGSDNYPPFNYMGTDGAPTGIDVELATEAFGRLGYRVAVRPLQPAETRTIGIAARTGARLSRAARSFVSCARSWAKETYGASE